MLARSEGHTYHAGEDAKAVPAQGKQTAKSADDRHPQVSPQAAITPGKGGDQSRPTTCKEPAAPAEDTTGSATGRAAGGQLRPAPARAIQDPMLVGCRPSQQKTQPFPHQ